MGTKLEKNGKKNYNLEHDKVKCQWALLKVVLMKTASVKMNSPS